jgi:hypothetical protein
MLFFCVYVREEGPMDGMLFNPKSWPLLGLLAVLAMGGIGCQSAQPVSVRRLVNHQAMVDFSGLKSPEHFEVVKAEAAVPASWPAQAVKRGPLYTDMQWRSPSGSMAAVVALLGVVTLGEPEQSAGSS